jgi:curved DNA-binding protein CbpA
VGTSLVVFNPNAKPSETYVHPSEATAQAQPEHEDLYLVLGISPEIDKPTPTQIRRAYQKAAMKFHPDKNGGTQEAKDRFQRIKLAYEVLTDPIKRQFYDDTGLIRPSPSQISGMALDMMHDLYNKAIDAALNEDSTMFDINLFDAVASVKEALKQQLKGLHELRAKQQRSISRLDNMKRRFKRRKGDLKDTPVYAMLETKHEQARRIFASVQVDLDIQELALKLADDYTCHQVTQSFNAGTLFTPSFFSS